MTTDLPPGWTWATLGEVGRYLNGRAFKATDWKEQGRPIIRIQNLTGSSRHHNHYQGEVEDRHLVREGDLLLSWAATLGVFVWRGEEAVLNQHIFKVESWISKSFHRWLLQFVLDDLYRQAHGSGMVHITKRKFDTTSVPIPPLSEQERIVAAIEEHFSRLDAVDASLNAAETRCQALIRSVIVGSIPTALPDDWQLKTVAEAGATGLGRQRSPKYHSGTNMKPYLRVANVFEDRIDTSSIMEMHFEEADFEKYRLRHGDILLNEGQSPELLGRPAIYRGEPPGVAFTNSLIRFVPGPEVTPEWALLVFRRHMHARRFMRESRITTNIAHLALGRFRTVEFPIPPLDTQHELVASTRAALSSIDQMIIQIQSARAKVNGIRRAVLAAAFSGQLVPQDPNDEPASVLLEGIAASRTARPRRQRVTA
ncbi:MAG: restriction endonuclease subunit S [Acidimicrobiaceae bacterium]|nr:restriction endonuclease subunit S [Acidimicrobiaceae bacterium]